MAEQKKEPLLNLDTLVERAVVNIDGVPYELINPGELSILDYHRIGRKGQQVEAIRNQDGDLSDDQVSELSRLLDSMCRVILRAPGDVHDRLSDSQRLQVVGVFSDLQRGKRAMPPAGGNESAPPTARSPIGESS